MQREGNFGRRRSLLRANTTKKYVVDDVEPDGELDTFFMRLLLEEHTHSMGVLLVPTSIVVTDVPVPAPVTATDVPIISSAVTEAPITDGSVAISATPTTPAPTTVDSTPTAAPTIIGGSSTTTFTSKQPTWPFEESDIPLDPNTTFGELDNGLRYYYKYNNEPPGQVQLRLHVDIGSNGEQDNELGMAHFLEHMAFRSTKTFPRGTDMDREFQARGIDFGTHINAYTTFDETVYYLGIPQPENSTLELGFAWMRDILDGMDLLQEELDIERGVVISELESRDSVGNRLWRKMLDVSICFLPWVYDVLCS